MTLENAAYIYRQSRVIRECILSVCDQWNVTLDNIQAPKAEKEFAARSGLICQLAKLGLQASIIDTIIKAETPEAYRVIKQHRTDYKIPSRVYI